MPVAPLEVGREFSRNLRINRGAQRRQVFWVMVMLTVIGMWVGWLAVARAASPSDGARISATTYPATEWRGGVKLHTVLDPPDAELQLGDKVIAVDGLPLSAWMTARSGHDFQIGDELSYRVVRDGVAQTIVVTLHRYDWMAAAGRSASVLVVEVALLIVAAIVVSRRVQDPAARVLFAIAVVLPFGFPSWPLYPQVLDLTLTPWPLWPQLLSSCVWALVWGAMIPHFALVFPRPPPVLARHRLVIPALYFLPFAMYGIYLAVTLPVTADPLERIERISNVSLVPQRVAPIAVIALIAWAYARTPDRQDRRRVTLVAVSFVAVFVISFLGVQLPQQLRGNALIAYPYNTWIFVLCPVAVAVAVLRHHLFDITVILRRSLLAAVLVTAIIGLYLTAWRLLGHPTRSELPAFLVGTVVALGIAPVYRKLKRYIDHRVYGARGDPYGLVEEIASLEAGDDPEGVLSELAATLGQALRIPYVAITLTDGDIENMHVVHGSRQTTSVIVRLAAGTKDMGFIELDAGPGREPFGPGDQRLLTSIANHTASTVQATMLNVELQSSRARLVTNREEERRRIRRDLHDGVGPTLALLAMSLEVVKDILVKDPDGAGEALDAAGARTHEAIAEIRRTVNDLRPPVLDELGLAGAIKLLAERMSSVHRQAGVPTLTVTVETLGNLKDLPAAVEVAAYRIICEAVTNVSRHSQAARCTVKVELTDALRIRVIDDGTGFRAHSPRGTGIASIHERAAELGGTADIGRGEPSGGTLLTASIPLKGFRASDDQ